MQDGTPGTILFVVPRFHNNLYFATRALVEAGFRVEVFAAQVVSKESHTHVTPRRFRAAGAELDRAFAEVDPDLVLIREAGELSRRVARLCRRRGSNAYEYHLAPASVRRPWLRRLAHRLGGRPVRRVTPVPGAGGQVAPGVTLLPWPVERMGPPGDPPPRGEGLRVLCVGKLADPKKNQAWLIDAIRAAELAPRVRLTLVGSSSLGAAGASAEKLAHLRAEAARNAWIGIREDVPFAEMAELYRSHDVCVLPSTREILGVAPLEGMAYGTVPMISMPSGSAGYVEDGVNGYRIDLARPERFGGILRELGDDPARLARLSRNALALAETELSPARFVERVRGLMGGDAGRGAGGRRSRRHRRQGRRGEARSGGGP